MTTKGTGATKETTTAAGAERSEAEAAVGARRGRPGRRSAEERTQAVLELLSGKATVDQLARRFGVYPATIEKWREVAIESMTGALRQGEGKTSREVALERRVKDLDIEIRAGIHTGEVELIGADVGGMAVHIGARIGALGGPGEVLASSTVRDLVVGSGIEFAARGSHALKGVPGEWELFAVESV